MSLGVESCVRVLSTAELKEYEMHLESSAPNSVTNSHSRPRARAVSQLGSLVQRGLRARHNPYLEFHPYER
jgi:hypothetical protein